MARKSNLLDITEWTFHFLTAKKIVGCTANKTPLWEFECVCGNRVIRQAGVVKSGSTKSCGCKKRELLSAAAFQHGHSNTKEYVIYQQMLQRCHNPECSDYARYGAKGIVVCERWREGFENFAADMGRAPYGTSLDRKEGTGPYSPDNCRWATSEEQNNNRCNNHNLTFKGKTQSIAQWSREMGLKEHTLSARIRLGWTVERALTQPTRKNTRH